MNRRNFLRGLAALPAVTLVKVLPAPDPAPSFEMFSNDELGDAVFDGMYRQVALGYSISRQNIDDNLYTSWANVPQLEYDLLPDIKNRLDLSLIEIGDYDVGNGDEETV